MNVRTICLAILQLGDSTGYEIRKCVADGLFSHFVDASYGSIYPALNKLEAEGLLDAHIEEQDGKPNRRVYSINDTGRAAFGEMLSGPIGDDTFKSPFLLLATYAQYLSREQISAAIDAQVKFLINELDLIDTAEAELPLAACNWVAEFGRNAMQSQLEYIYENRAALEEIAGTSSLTNKPQIPAIDAAE